jgi:nicotinate-nucleotide pyrophosphorylase (carboxylating)
MFEKIISAALKEDKALRDITSDLTIPAKQAVNFEINAREEIIFCGSEVIKETFSQLKKSAKFKDSKLQLIQIIKDGDKVKSGQTIAKGQGDARLIFAAERVVLNLIQHLSGVATQTHKIVKKLNNKKIKILDTRKTIPGLRIAQKYAVKVGGGSNHRLDLAEMILIKDNHIAAAGGIEMAIKAAKKALGKKIEVECDNFKQVVQAVKSSPDIIMLDNMNADEIKKCSAEIRKNKKIKIEISGGINAQNIDQFSNLDIDFISMGALTHSVRAIDIGLDIKK